MISRQLKHLNIKSYIVSGALWGGTGKALIVLLTLVFSMIASRLLSYGDYGTLVLVQSIAVFFSILVKLGLDIVLLREASKVGLDEHDADFLSLLLNLIIIILISAAITLSVIFLIGFDFFYSHSSSKDHRGMNSFVAIIAFGIAVQCVVCEFFRGFRQVKLASIFSGALSGTISIAVLATLIILRVATEIQDVLAVLVFGYAINFLVGWFAASRLLTISYPRKVDKKIRPKISIMWKLLCDSMPLMANEMTYYVLANSALWIIAMRMSAEDLALYGAALKLVVAIGFFLNIANSFLPPLVSSLAASGDFERLERLLRSMATVITVPAAVIVVLYLLFSEQILQIVYGSRFFSEATVVLITLAVANLVSSMVGSAGFGLIMMGYSRVCMANSFAACGISVFGAFMMIDSYGLVGVAFAFGSGTIYQQLSNLFALKYFTGVSSYLYLSGNIISRVKSGFA